MTLKTSDILRSLYSNSQEAVIATDTEYCILSINPAAQQLFGYNPEALVGKNLQTLHAKAHTLQDRNTDPNIGKSSAQARRKTIQYRTNTGRIFDGDTIEVDITTEESTRTGYLFITQDVTERLSLMAKLEASDIQLRAALSSANEGVYSLNLQTGLGSVRGFITEFLGGQSSDATISHGRWMEIIHPDDRGSYQAALDKVRKSPGETLDIIFRAHRADRKLRWLQYRGRVTEFSRDGNALRVSGIVSDVTETLELEQKLAASEHLLASAIEAGSCGVWEVDPRIETQTIKVRGEIQAMIGVEPENETINMDLWLDRMDEEGLNKIRLAHNRLVAGEIDVFDVTYKIRDARTDKWVWIRSQGKLIKDADETPSLVGILTNVSNQKTLENQLAEKERMLREAIEAASLGIWKTDFEEKTVWIRGPAVVTLFGEGDETTVSTFDWLDMVHPDDVKALNHHNKRIFEGETDTAELEYRLKSHTGDWIWFRANGQAGKRGPKGQVMYTTGVIQNIDETKHLNSALDEEILRFEDIYRATPAMLHSLDTKGNFIEVSDYWLSYLGYSRQEVIGKTISDFLDSDSAQKAKNIALPELLSTGKVSNISYRFRRKTGEYLDVLISAFLEKSDSGEPLHCFSVMTDITPLQAAYKALERTNRELDNFAAIASHDLQEPLRKISAFASLVHQKYANQLDHQGKRSLVFLVDAAQRMQNLINDLLSYSKMSKQALKLEPVSLSYVIAEVLNQIDNAVQESGALIKVNDMPVLNIDPVMIEQIFQNLISNAIKYRSENQPVIEISARQSKNEWIIAVKDNGIGFETRFAGKIFAPFQRLHTRKEYPGTGIGLAIVQQVIERHGGKVWVESAPDAGSTFFFSLPISPESDKSESSTEN